MVVSQEERDGMFSRNYQVLKSQVIDDGFEGFSVLVELNRRVKDLGVKVFEDLRPVSYEEAQIIYENYYNEKAKKTHSKTALKQKKYDYLRKKAHVLHPGAPESYLYRPKAQAKRSGPEMYDMAGIDDNPEDVIGNGMPPKLFGLVQKSINKS